MLVAMVMVMAMVMAMVMVMVLVEVRRQSSSQAGEQADGRTGGWADGWVVIPSTFNPDPQPLPSISPGLDPRARHAVVFDAVFTFRYIQLRAKRRGEQYEL